MYFGWFLNSIENGIEITELPKSDIIADLKLEEDMRTHNASTVVSEHVLAPTELGGDMLILKLLGGGFGVYDVPTHPEEDEKVIIAKDEEHAMRLFWSEFKRG